MSHDNNGTKAPLSPILYLFFVGCILLFHFMRVSALIPRTSFLSTRPLATHGYGQLYSWTLRDAAFRQVSGRGFGYDPFQMAGVPAGNILERESQLSLSMLRGLKRFVSPEKAVKLWTYMAYLSLPLILFASVLLLNLGGMAALVSLALGVVGFAGFDLLSPGLVRNGDIDFILSCYLALLASSYFMYSLRRQKPILILAGILFLSLVSWANPSVGVITLIVAGCLALSQVKTMDLKLRLIFIVLFFVALVIHYYWGKPFYDLSVHLLPIDKDRFTWTNLAHTFLIFWGRGSAGVTVILRAMVFVGCLLGLRLLFRRDRLLAGFFLAWMGLLIFYAGIGSHMPYWVNSTPKRTLLLFSLVQIPIAAYYLSHFLGSPVRLRDKMGLVVFGIFFIWQVALSGIYQPLALMSLERDGNLIQELKNLPQGGRILIEEDDPSHRIRDAYPILTGQSILGTPGLHSRMAQFADTGFFRMPQSRELILFNMKFDQYNEAGLIGAFRVYNVRYIVAFSLPARAKFDRYPQTFRRLPSIFHIIHSPSGWPAEWRLDQRRFRASSRHPAVRVPYVIYEVVPVKPSYFLSGSGQIEMDYGQIRIRHPSPGFILLKFNWYHGFRAKPRWKLKPFYFLKGAYPFLQIDNLSSSDTITLSTIPN